MRNLCGREKLIYIYILYISVCAHHICLSATSTVLNSTASFHNTPGAMWHLSHYTTAVLQHSGASLYSTLAASHSTLLHVLTALQLYPSTLAILLHTAASTYYCSSALQLLHPLTIAAHCCMPILHWLHCSILLCPLTIVAHCCRPVQYSVCVAAHCCVPLQHSG